MPAEPKKESRRKSVGRVQCQCGKWLTLWAETEEWTQTRTGRWRHSSYGPGEAFCERCSVVHLDSPWDGMMSFKVPEVMA